VQPQVHAQVLLRLLAGTPPQEAVAAPRFAVGATELGEPATTVRAEVDCAPEALRALRAAGFDAVEVPARSGYLGHAQVIWIDGEELGASDPRADGSALRVQ
jgi:gamma-glutamyltranspeptidase/glutathione hydrolase